MSSRNLYVAVSVFLIAAGAVLSAQVCGGGTAGIEAGAADDGNTLLGNGGGQGQGGDVGQGGATLQDGSGIQGGGGAPGDGGNGGNGGNGG